MAKADPSLAPAMFKVIIIIMIYVFLLIIYVGAASPPRHCGGDHDPRHGGHRQYCQCGHCRPDDSGSRLR